MADIGTMVFRKAKAQMLCHAGFFPQKFGNRVKTADCSRERQTCSDALPYFAPAYLKLPSLQKAQKIISARQDIQTPCRILDVLNQIFPIAGFLADKSDPVTLLIHCLQKWLESFMPAEVLNKLDLEFEICPASEADTELFDCLQEEEYLVRFGLGSFQNSYFPLEDVIARYNKIDPQLGKYLLKLLNDCPLSIGTPETIYEFISYFCWGGESDSAEIVEERVQEYVDGGESEEDAREYAEESVIIDYAEVEENFPQWTYLRDQRLREYRGIIPDELQRLVQLYHTYLNTEKQTSYFPSVCYPGIIASLDQKGYDFSCDAVNRVSNEQIQCGGSFAITTLGWSISPDNTNKMIQTLREIRTTLAYFGACVEFLINHEKEYPRA